MKMKNWTNENALNVGYVLLHVLLWVVIAPGILALIVSSDNRTSLTGVIGAFAVGPALIFIILKMFHDWYFDISTFWQVLIPSLVAFFFGHIFGQVHEDKENIRKYGPGWRLTAFMNTYNRSQQAASSNGVNENSVLEEELDPVDLEIDRKIEIQDANIYELIELQNEYKLIVLEGENNLNRVTDEIRSRQRQEQWYVHEDEDRDSSR